MKVARTVWSGGKSEDNFSIYQINTDRDNNRVCFLGLDTLERFQHSKEVDPALYDRIYDGKLDCSSLETIYEKFNIDHPADYKGRSLSVSDVVEIRESDTLNPGFYFVDSIGFKSISFDKSLCKEPVKASDGKISVLLVEPNKYPKMIEIDDTLEAMQEVVGGDIEEYMPFEDEVAIICNEEGKITGMAPNRAVYEENSREMLDIICGKFFIVYAPFEAERFQSLPPDLAEKYREKFKYPERFMRVNNEIVAVPFKPVRAVKEASTAPISRTTIPARCRPCRTSGPSCLNSPSRKRRKLPLPLSFSQTAA